MEIINLVYKKSGEDDRLDKYLAAELEDVTRSYVQMLIKDGLVLVNGKAEKANYILKDKDVIDVTIKDLEEVDIVAQDIPLDIVYEDSDIIVINKPSGMVVHPGAGNYQDTLVNALMYHCTDLSGINGEIRAGIVHRIDKDTSGLLVACKNDFAHRNLSIQFSEKQVTKKYIAICSGVISHNLGKIDAPLARDPKNRQQMSVQEGGKTAITNFKVIERFKKHTLIEVLLETGRTHQIRVHMKYIGYPIVGDPIYGYRSEVDPEHGQYLHAKELSFYHPRTGELLSFSAPLPDYFEKKIEQLRKEE